MPARKRAETPPSVDDEEHDIPIEEPSTTINPYATLNVEKTASADQIKRAYRLLALKHHPDKVAPSDKEDAHTKFQEIALAYAILSDDRRRKRYDITGRTEDSLDIDDDGDFAWADFYRAQFEDVITEASIETFRQEYQGSDEERQDVLKWYVEGQGRIDVVFQSVMLSDMEVDEERFRAIIDAAIKNGEVEALKYYKGETKAARKKRIATSKKHNEREAKEAEDLAEELGLKDKLAGMKKGKGKESDPSGLAALIQQRQKGRSENFLADLEAKYAPKGKGKGGKRAAIDEPPEEAFVKTAARMKKSKKE